MGIGVRGCGVELAVVQFEWMRKSLAGYVTERALSAEYSWCQVQRHGSLTSSTSDLLSKRNDFAVSDGIFYSSF